MRQIPPERLAIYLDLEKDEIVRLILCLLVEELLKERLDAFRTPEFPVIEDRTILIPGPPLIF